MDGRLIAVALLSATAAVAAATGQERQVPTGAWGGEHLALTVTSDGATLEFDCATGAIATPLVTDAAGHFVASGDYSTERGGAVRPNEPPPRHAAEYTGDLTGTTLVVRVSLPESKETLGPFTVVKDQAARLHKCR